MESIIKYIKLITWKESMRKLQLMLGILIKRKDENFLETRELKMDGHRFTIQMIFYPDNLKQIIVHPKTEEDFDWLKEIVKKYASKKDEFYLLENARIYFDSKCMIVDKPL